ncbi:hypothetical protein ACR6C2_07485 [Streptomyces sp. INA 01156]
MADQTLSRPFQLHLPDERVMHGAEFPSGRVFIDGPDDDRPASIYAISLDAALESFPGAVMVWPEDIARLADG